MGAAARRERVERQAEQSETFGGGSYGADDVSDDEYDPMYGGKP